MEQSKWAAVQEEMNQMVATAIARIKVQHGKEGILSFAEREKIAANISASLAEYLLEKDLLLDPKLEKQREIQSQPCPRCGQLGQRLKKKDGSVVEGAVEIETTVGKLPFSTALFRCKKCRRNFSPLKSRITTGE